MFIVGIGCILKFSILVGIYILYYLGLDLVFYSLEIYKLKMNYFVFD